MVIFMEKILNDVIKKIKPTVDEQKGMDEAVKKVLEIAERLSKTFSAKPVLCGSVAKGTWIPPGEIDLFLLFSKDLPRKKLKDYGMKLAKDIIAALGGRYRIAYTEHPYITGIIRYNEKNYSIDIVPCYDISPEKIKSAVDRTPHHVKFVQENLKEKQKDDVRLLKKFCIAQECYGADLKVQGFSGYLCELLVIKYGSFEEVVRDASRWEVGVTINGEGKDTSNFKNQALVVIDPVDTKRNVSTAVSPETFYKFAKACKSFEKNPSEKFFEKYLPKPLTVEEVIKLIEKRGTNLYAVRFKKPKVAEDVLYSQLRKFSQRVQEMIEGRDFKILQSEFYCDSSCILILEAEVWEMPKIKKHVGPSVFSNHAKEFLKHYKNFRIFMENSSWATEYHREFSSLLDYLKHSFGKDLNELKARGIPSHIADSISKGHEIFSGEDFLRLTKRMPEDFRAFLRKYFEKNLSLAD